MKRYLFCCWKSALNLLRSESLTHFIVRSCRVLRKIKRNHIPHFYVSLWNTVFLCKKVIQHIINIFQSIINVTLSQHITFCRNCSDDILIVMSISWKWGGTWIVPFSKSLFIYQMLVIFNTLGSIKSGKNIMYTFAIWTIIVNVSNYIKLNVT